MTGNNLWPTSEPAPSSTESLGRSSVQSNIATIATSKTRDSSIRSISSSGSHESTIQQFFPLPMFIPVGDLGRDPFADPNNATA